MQDVLLYNMAFTTGLILCRGVDRITTHIMQVEIYRDTEEFCATAHYQQWLSQWQPPRGAQVDLWVDNDQELWRTRMTPRHQSLTRWTTRLQFHLLESIQPGHLPCVDVGCGHNWLKQFHPGIWGVDPRSPQHRDEELTPEWWVHNWGRWPRAFAINSLHFCPQREIPHQLAKLGGLLSPGGRAFVALNRARVRDHTQDYQEELMRDQLAQIAGLTRMVWLEEPRDAAMDGNVWLWLRA